MTFLLLAALWMPPTTRPYIPRPPREWPEAFEPVIIIRQKKRRGRTA